MRRADRLLQIVQILRRQAKPTTAAALASELEVAVRTVYRDIATLQASRLPVEGEAGVGYVLKAGYDLPPLMFNSDELEAIVLGARMVIERGDPDLGRAAADVLGKVRSVVPKTLADELWRADLLVPHPLESGVDFGAWLPVIRRAIRDGRKLAITYRDARSEASSRTVWPLGLYLYSHLTLVCAWCELRGGFRTFRSDRLTGCDALSERFDPRGGALMRQFLIEFATARPDVSAVRENVEPSEVPVPSS
jgi:predicted DNA-binding transcriptional regulator YafY